RQLNITMPQLLMCATKVYPTIRVENFMDSYPFGARYKLKTSSEEKTAKQILILQNKNSRASRERKETILLGNQTLQNGTGIKLSEQTHSHLCAFVTQDPDDHDRFKPCRESSPSELINFTADLRENGRALLLQWSEPERNNGERSRSRQPFTPQFFPLALPQVRVAESPATAVVSIACSDLSPQRVEIPMLIPQERVKTKLHLVRPKRRMRQEILSTAQGSRVSSDLLSLSLAAS
ncbi:hypothetical protein U0070_019925, partial [Myodes glareolus]